MIQLLKDRYKLGLLMATLFFLGIVVSIYMIYSLPHQLMIGDGYESSFARIYLILGGTFLLGAIAIWQGLHYRNEIIVFRDKQTQADNAEKDSNQSAQTTISLDSLRVNIKQAKDTKELLQSGLHTVCKQLDAGQGAVYMSKSEGTLRKMELQSGYALSIGESATISFEFGDGLIGQAAIGGKTLYVDEIPDGYIRILSGLGSASPRFLLIVPIKKGDQVLGIMEIASFTAISEDQRKFVEESAQLIADAITVN
jgi:transcriptional regulator with GAF, ATPase, and Fis domain